VSIKVFAFFIAIVLPGLVLGLVSLSAGEFFAVTVVSCMHAVLLGLPLYLVLNKFNLVNIYTSSIGGFLVASIPIGVLSWPSERTEMKTSSSDSSYGQTMIDGIPTEAGWLQYSHGVLYFACIGLVCGLVFWLIVYFWEKSTNKQINKD
jgi:hypothetical protein